VEERSKVVVCTMLVCHWSCGKQDTYGVIKVSEALGMPFTMQCEANSRQRLLTNYHLASRYISTITVPSMWSLVRPGATAIQVT